MRFKRLHHNKICLFAGRPLNRDVSPHRLIDCGARPNAPGLEEPGVFNVIREVIQAVFEGL
jgi:hypothetical protein